MFRHVAVTFALGVSAIAFTSALGAQSITGMAGLSCGAAPSTAARQCARGHFCEPRPGQCSTQKTGGSCVRTPEVCTMIYQPVCGCNGKTYGNDCERRAHRVGKKHDGAC